VNFCGDFPTSLAPASIPEAFFRPQTGRESLSRVRAQTAATQLFNPVITQKLRDMERNSPECKRPKDSGNSVSRKTRKLVFVLSHRFLARIFLGMPTDSALSQKRLNANLVVNFKKYILLKPHFLPSSIPRITVREYYLFYYSPTGNILFYLFINLWFHFNLAKIKYKTK